MTAQPTDAVAQELQQANIDFVVIPPASDLEGVRQNYVDLFRCSMARRPAPKWQRNTSCPLTTNSLRSSPAWDAAGEKNISTVYVAGDLLQIATGDSFEGYILELLGTQNWGADYTNYSYPQEKEVDLNPDVIFYNGMESPGDHCRLELLQNHQRRQGRSPSMRSIRRTWNARAPTCWIPSGPWAGCSIPRALSTMSRVSPGELSCLDGLYPR